MWHTFVKANADALTNNKEESTNVVTNEENVVEENKDWWSHSGRGCLQLKMHGPCRHEVIQEGAEIVYSPRKNKNK